jgi:hypothetical protein
MKELGKLERLWKLGQLGYLNGKDIEIKDKGIIGVKKV